MGEFIRDVASAAGVFAVIVAVLFALEAELRAADRRRRGAYRLPTSKRRR